MEATPSVLVLWAQASDEVGLRRVVDVVTAHLGGYSRRGPLTVRWQRELQPEHQDAEHSGGAASGREGELAVAGRGGHRRAAVLVGVVIVVVAVHLGLGSWLLTSSCWTGTAIGTVLAIVVAKAAAVGLVSVRRARAAQRAEK